MALLERCDFPEQGYLEKFRNAKSERNESPSLLIVRIGNSFYKWVELSEIGKTFEGVEEVMFRELLTNSCPRDESVILKKRILRNLEELAQMADQYLDTHSKKLRAKSTVAKSLRDLEAKRIS